MSLFNYECDEVKRIIDEVSPNYPQLTTYEKEWIYFYKFEYTPGTPVELEYQEVIVNPTATVQNAIPHQYKSAILKGNTLVNLLKVNKNDYIINLNANKWSVEDGYLKCDSTTGWHTITDKFNSSIKANTKYLIIVEMKENTLNMKIAFDGYGTTLGSATTFLSFEPNEVGTKKAIVSTISTLDNIKSGFFRIPLNIANSNSILEFRAMAIEYQEGMENWDISYFEGMQSVQMPVLTTSNEDGTKTNILTVNEPVELRGIGDVQDELNLLTGELIQRIGEITFDGSENWIASTNQERIAYILPHNGTAKMFSSPISDKWICKANANATSDTFFYVGGSYFNYITNQEVSLSDFKAQLSDNPISVQYFLTTESIKTVDLTTLTKPYEGTNLYQLTANIPCEAILEVPVVSTGEQTLSEINNY